MMGNLLDPDLEFQDLGIDELRVIATRHGESVLRRGRAMMELGRRASGNPALLDEVADLVRVPENMRLLTVGTVSVSQLGTAGLIAGGSARALAMAAGLAAEWQGDGQSDFARLMRSSGIAWPPDLRMTGAGA
jgi:hypothetical protein